MFKKNVMAFGFAAIAQTALAANDAQVGTCAAGIMAFTKDVNLVRAALAKADNPKNAQEIAATRLDRVEMRPDGGFSERGLKKLMMEHHNACQSVNIRSAIQ